MVKYVLSLFKTPYRNVHLLFLDCKVWFEPLQWTLRKCMDLNVSIGSPSQTKAETYAAEAFFSKYILNNSHNDRTTSPPTTSKAESQAYSHCKSDHTATITPLLHLQITWRASCGYTMREGGPGEAMATTVDVNWRAVSSGKSCAVVSVTRFFFLPFGFKSLFYMKPLWRLQWKIETKHISQ